MKYYRDVDYYLYFEEFPHAGIPGVIIGNSDGTANIYINTLCSIEKQNRTIKHELRHLAKEHLSCDWMTIEEKELEADDIFDSSCVFGDNFSYVECVEEIVPPEAKKVTQRLPDIFEENPTEIPVFNSLEVLKNYMIALKEQYKREEKFNLT